MEAPIEPVKRPRGRPPKPKPLEPVVKRPRGRPRKHGLPEIAITFEEKNTAPPVTVPTAPPEPEPLPEAPEQQVVSKAVKNGKVRNSSLLSIASKVQLGDWEGRNLCVCFPCYRQTNYVTAAILVSLALDFGREKIRFEFCGGDAMVYKTRNKVAHQFMETGSEWSVWLDDDMIPPIGRAEFLRTHVLVDEEEMPDEILNRHFVNRLLAHKKTLVGACYFGRRSIAPPMFHEGMHEAESNRAARAMTDQVRPTQWVGTGCVLIHRQVFLDIQAKFPELGPTPEYPYWDYFLPEKNAGEDVAFCRRAAAAGHQAFVDLGLQCLHIGYSAYGAHNTKQPLPKEFV